VGIWLINVGTQLRVKKLSVQENTIRCFTRQQSANLSHPQAHKSQLNLTRSLIEKLRTPPADYAVPDKPVKAY